MDASSSPASFADVDPESHQFLSRLIRRKARQIARRAEFAPGDTDDIEQQLSFKVARQLGAYDRSKSDLHQFFVTVVERHAVNLIRDQNAQKRNPRQVVSLSLVVDVKGEGPTELSATISQRDADARLARSTRHHESASDLRQDVNAAIDKLPPDARGICEQLKCNSITGVARELAIPRSTLYDMMARWRRTFEEEDLQEYL